MITLIHWYIFTYIIKRSSMYLNDLWMREDLNDRYNIIMIYTLIVDIVLGFIIFVLLKFYNYL